jgi:hypothetical protein
LKSRERTSIIESGLEVCRHKKQQVLENPYSICFRSRMAQEARISPERYGQSAAIASFVSQ